MTNGAERELLTNLYARFNARDLDAVLAAMHPRVEWPNGWEGGYVHGRDGIRAYWTRLWKALDPHVAPIDFETDDDGHTIVEVHQIVRDLDGHVVSDSTISHVYTFDDGLIRRMEILEQ